MQLHAIQLWMSFDKVHSRSIIWFVKTEAIFYMLLLSVEVKPDMSIILDSQVSNVYQKWF